MIPDYGGKRYGTSTAGSDTTDFFTLTANCPGIWDRGFAEFQRRLERTVNTNRRPEWLPFDDRFAGPPLKRPANVRRFEQRQHLLRKLRRRNRRRER